MQWLLVILLVPVILSGCDKSEASSQDYSNCINRGVSYYKDIGSYPTLKSENISAENQARLMCSNSKNTAFS